MLSLIQHETVEAHHWLSTSEFTDIVAISQMTPGPIGINSATYCGYTAIQNAGYGHLMAILGSTTATFALVYDGEKYNAITGGGAGGTGDYNDLENIPITNLTATFIVGECLGAPVAEH